jgi:DNA processing protein
VVEAKQKSGALITANYAIEQNKKLLAIPGNIFSAQSQGVNGLFEKGAVPVQSPEDILEVLFKRKCGRKALKINTGLHEPANLAPEEKQILKHIPYDKPAPLNLIIRKVGLPTARVVAATTQLEIKGLIESSDGGYIKI